MPELNCLTGLGNLKSLCLWNVPVLGESFALPHVSELVYYCNPRHAPWSRPCINLNTFPSLRIPASNLARLDPVLCRQLDAFIQIYPSSGWLGIPSHVSPARVLLPLRPYDCSPGIFRTPYCYYLDSKDAHYGHGPTIASITAKLLATTPSDVHVPLLILPPSCKCDCPAPFGATSDWETELEALYAACAARGIRIDWDDTARTLDVSLVFWRYAREVKAREEADKQQ
ncbi:hypothetical protein JCM8097_003988 [Rhodosporidiobolus ruineniae]